MTKRGHPKFSNEIKLLKRIIDEKNAEYIDTDFWNSKQENIPLELEIKEWKASIEERQKLKRTS